MSKIFLAEDDQNLADVLADWLEQAHHGVEVVHDGDEADFRLKTEQYDLIILDWDLPRLSGIEVCRRFREAGGSTPVIMLTGHSLTEEKVQGLDSGADDYVTKPFEFAELNARIRALLRRPQETKTNVLKAGDLELDATAAIARKQGNPIALLPREFALLEFFMRHPNQVFSADALLNRVWSTESGVAPDTVRVHITKLRSKIDTPGKQSMIQTVHRVGYRFDPPVH